MFNNNGHGEGIDTYCTFSFEYNFEFTEDEVWFAHAVPYTCTDLMTELKQIKGEEEVKPASSRFLKMNMLCKTLAGIPCPLLTITSDIDTYQDYYEEVRLN